MTETGVSADENRDEQGRRKITLEELQARADAGELGEEDREVWERLGERLKEATAASHLQLEKTMSNLLEGLKTSMDISNHLPEIHLSLPKVTIAGLTGGGSEQPIEAVDITPNSNGAYIVKLSRRLNRLEAYAASKIGGGGWTIAGDEIQIRLLEDDADLVAQYTKDAIHELAEKTTEIQAQEAAREKSMNETADEAKRRLGLKSNE